ncbi:MAG: O-acetylhomoserine aminocarboxypropyltransferase/cysteine synthase [Eubacteriales bacterium]|nr:O-acetylhomoserine aminocarboxypropyltransferase/cysteine synthase [Eubacteriales bacterium]
MNSDYHINTKCVQGGYRPENGEPRVPAICQSTTFKYDSAGQMGQLFDLEASGDFYTRLGNPTFAAAEAKLAELEGGIGALLTSSGQAASMLAVLNLCRSGDHVVSTSSIYGGTYNLFNKTLRDMGINFTFVEADCDEATLKAAIQADTKLVFAETLSNPTLVVLDIEKFARVAHAHHIPLIVDNTFPTPVNCRPFEFGADIITHSTTKYLDGHARSMGGVIIDSGRFDWRSGNFPGLTEPDETYHGIVYVDQFGPAAYIAKARTHLMRDIGAIISPMNAFLLHMGIETLFLRMERHCANAQAVAEFLEKDPRISWVEYPGLPGNRGYELAKKYMPNGTCGVISFGVRDGREAAIRLMEAMRLAAIVTHVADARTCVLHPAGTTHRQLSDEQLKAAGIGPEMIRLSVGIEHIDDILADLKQALETLN